MQKREVDIVVISDIHLGTYGCHAQELCHYLQSIQPKTFIINGDFIDGWNFSKKYFPDAHFAVIQLVIQYITSGVDVIYITGNHDEFLRKYSGLSLSNFKILDKVVLHVDQKKHWIFHGDIFDRSTRGFSKYLAIWGGKGYDWLIRFNRVLNFVLEKTGHEKYSLSKKVKDSVRKAVRFIADFEQMAADQAIHQGYDVVICGHIHNPQMKTFVNAQGSVQYLNSGDWVENLSALEYHEGCWKLYQYPKHDKPLAEKLKFLNQWPQEYVTGSQHQVVNDFLKFYFKHHSI